MVKLDSAAKSAARDGKASVKSYFNEVSAQSGKAIPADKATILIALAGAL